MSHYSYLFFKKKKLVFKIFYLFIYLKQLGFLKYIYLFIYLFLAALGLRCCTQAFSSCGEQGLLFFVAHELLIAVSSLAEHGL